MELAAVSAAHPRVTDRKGCASTILKDLLFFRSFMAAFNELWVRKLNRNSIAFPTN